MLQIDYASIKYLLYRIPDRLKYQLDQVLEAIHTFFKIFCLAKYTSIFITKHENRNKQNTNLLEISIECLVTTLYI